MLTRERFWVLSTATRHGVSALYPLCRAGGLTEARLRELVTALEGEGLLAEGGVTDAGRDVLLPYRVEHAVLLAAGSGKRLLPATAHTPKPLIRVNGVRIVDTLLDAILAAGITDIVMVRGYLSEQFDSLQDRYPMLRFVENAEFEQYNNIASALLAAESLPNSYIMDADLYLRNPELITAYQYETNFLGVPVAHTDDLALFVQDGRVVDYRRGGDGCYRIVGLSYWTREDGEKLQRDLPRMFATDAGKQMYWEQAPLNLYPDDYRITVRPCTDADVAEIDTVSDLDALNASFRHQTGGGQ